MSLLPSRKSSPRVNQDGTVKVLGLSNEETTSVLDAIGSMTSRTLLSEIYKQPATPSELAERTDMSLQSISYHLENLCDAELVRIIDTQYSQKGREMNVYAPTEDSVVLFVGTDERKTTITDFLKRIFAAVSILAMVSLGLLIQALGRPGVGGQSTGPLLPTGAAFFLGGLFILILTVWWWLWIRRAG